MCTEKMANPSNALVGANHCTVNSWILHTARSKFASDTIQHKAPQEVGSPGLRLRAPAASEHEQLHQESRTTFTSGDSVAWRSGCSPHRIWFRSARVANRQPAGNPGAAPFLIDSRGCQRVAAACKLPMPIQVRQITISRAK